MCVKNIKNMQSDIRFSKFVNMLIFIGNCSCGNTIYLFALEIFTSGQGLDLVGAYKA